MHLHNITFCLAGRIGKFVAQNIWHLYSQHCYPNVELRRNIAQAVSRRILTAEGIVQSQGSPCGIYV
jgi:hypothetical protein